jgi:DinB superfamily
VTLPSVADVLVVQLRHAMLDSRRALDDLMEDEYLWEPATPCWSIRRRGSAVRGWGRGEFVCEDAWPPPDPLPTTTIAWRVIHLAAWTDIYRQFAFVGARPDLNDADVPGNMRDGLAWLFRAQDEFIAAVTGLSDDAVFEPRPTHLGAPVPVVQIVSIMMTEHVHHLAEIGVLRDLHRGHAVTKPRTSALHDPSWWTGFPSIVIEDGRPL